MRRGDAGERRGDGMGRVSAVAVMMLGGLVLSVRALWRDGARVPPTPADDERTAQTVHRHLRRELGVRSEDVAVRVRRGRVTLRGDVPTVAEMVRLESQIRGLPGVLGVTNLLRLTVNARPRGRDGVPQGLAWLP